MEKPFSPSCERNQGFIFDKLAPIIEQYGIKTVLEIASGTGQHGVFFARQLNSLLWQPSDLANSLEGISLWVDEAKLNNMLAPIELDVAGQWPTKTYDAIYTANSLHIMSAQNVERFFQNLSWVSLSGCLLMVYGPFNRGGAFTSESNAAFDTWLKIQNPLSGIRDFEWVNSLAKTQGFKLLADHALPANNCFIIWQKT